MLKVAIIFAVTAVYCVQGYNRYYLHTKSNVHWPERLTPYGDLPSQSLLNPEDRTILLIHGHEGSASSPFNNLNREVILGLRDPTNLIVVDWEYDASHSYSVASDRVSNVARDLEHFIKWLDVTVGVDASKLHLVGFGLGAHIAGLASRWFRNFSAKRSFAVGRITGLDPSGNGFDGSSLALTPNSADYVEVIHTDTGLLGNGIGTAIGQVNFYANGGNNQPGCLTHTCSHNRAYELFAASLINPSLVGRGCSSMLQVNLNTCRGISMHMGGTDILKNTTTQIYRINTGRTYPY